MEPDTKRDPTLNERDLSPEGISCRQIFQQENIREHFNYPDWYRVARCMKLAFLAGQLAGAEEAEAAMADLKNAFDSKLFMLKDFPRA